MNNPTTARRAGLLRSLAVRLLTLLALAWTLLGPAHAAGPWASLAEVARDGGRVGVAIGTVFEPYVRRDLPQAQLVGFNNVGDLVTAVKAGKIDAAILDSISAANVARLHPEIGVLDEGFVTYPLGIGFAPARREMRERFDRFLAEIRADGRYETIHRRWFVDDPEQAQMPDLRARQPRQRVVFAVAPGDMPYVAYKDGRYVGFDLEIVQAFAAQEGIALDIQGLDFGALIPALASGRADIIADGMAITEERSKRVDFSTPYGEGRGAALVLKSRMAAAPEATAKGTGSSASAGLALRGMQDLATRRIAVFSGTSHDLFVSATYPQAPVTRFNSQADFVLSLKTGRVDAAILDLVTAETILRGNPDLALLADDFSDTDIAAAARPDDRALLQAFEAFLQAARQDGTLQAVHRRWNVADPARVAMPAIELPTTGPRLRIGTSLILGLPFVTQTDGRFVGQEIELAQRFAAHAGRVLEIVPLEFDALIAALTVGKIDLIMAQLSVTEERRRHVAFSSPYARERSAALVRRVDLDTSRQPAAAPAPAPGGWLGLAASFEANFVTESRWKLVLSGLWTTLTISLASTLLGTALGALVCWARMSTLRAARDGARLYIGLVRGTPVLLLLMLIYYVVFAKVDVDPVLVAVVAFGMNFAAYVAEMFRSGVEGVDRGQFEAGVAMGFTPLQAFAHIVMPQAVRRILPVYRGEFISLVKMTSIVGYIGVQDLTKASDIIRSRTFEAFFPLIMVALLYFAVIGLLGLMLDALDRRTDPLRQRGRRTA